MFIFLSIFCSFLVHLQIIHIHLRVQGDHVPAGRGAVRPVRQLLRQELVPAPVRAQGAHHGRGRGPAAALPQLHPRRDRQRRPAAERVARDAAAAQGAQGHGKEIDAEVT